MDTPELLKLVEAFLLKAGDPGWNDAKEEAYVLLVRLLHPEKEAE